MFRAKITLGGQVDSYLLLNSEILEKKLQNGYYERQKTRVFKLLQENCRPPVNQIEANG